MLKLIKKLETGELQAFIGEDIPEGWEEVTEIDGKPINANNVKEYLDQLEGK